MAYIHKRGKKWTAQIGRYDIHNKRKYDGCPTKRQAQEWANKLEVAKSDSQRPPYFAEYYID